MDRQSTYTDTNQHEINLNLIFYYSIIIEKKCKEAYEKSKWKSKCTMFWGIELLFGFAISVRCDYPVVEVGGVR